MTHILDAAGTDDVEPLVRRRTAELLRSNETLRDQVRQLWQENAEFRNRLEEAKANSLADRERRRAALNLMEDALESRRRADAINAELQQEILRRQRVEGALRASEDRFRQVAEVAPQFVWVHAADGSLEYVNQRWMDYTGLSLAATADPNQLIRVLHQEETDELFRRWQKSLAAGETFEIEIRLRGIDGAFRWHLMRTVPLRDERGQLIKWYGTATDIDQQKQLHEELKVADGRKNEFLAMLGHELRNPLAAIKGGIELLQSARVKETTRAAAVPIVAQQILHMERLLNDLLDVARVTQGKIEIRKVPVILQEILQNAAAMVHDLVCRQNCELHLEMPAEPIQLAADPVRLVQVFVNLLSNSAKYSGAGCVIELTVERQVCEVIVQVQDHGQGISPDLLPRVFDIFVQSAHSLDRSNGGLGLGLSVVRKIVELHGGNVQASSKGEGKGSEFIVCLPLKEKSAE
jgi:PAS domain S-box-containing protein